MDPIVCSAMFPASAYAICPWLDIFDMKIDTAAPATARGGMHDNITSVRSHPFTNATTKPPMKVETSCMNFPTWTNNTVVQV